MKRATHLLIGVILYVFLSCNGDGYMEEKIEQIKRIGNDNPVLAMRMLDSLSTSVRDMTERTAMKHDLLKLRLQDKSYIVASSDLTIKRLLQYYEKTGSIAEKQEVYYYAGSVYRDLQDTPRAITYFLKSSELANADKSCDPVMQKNAYSNLFYLFFHVQDYHNAHKYAHEEYEQSRKMGTTDIIALTHLGDALRSLDSLEQARKLFAMVLDTVAEDTNMRNDLETICNLLLELSFLNDTTNAGKCHTLINMVNKESEKNPRQSSFDEDSGEEYALAQYYKMVGKRDSAKYFYQQILQKGADQFRMYDASKAMFQFYYDEGNTGKATEYANLYIQLCDSIDLGKRQEMAATVNNEYQYHLDKNKERQMMEENARSRFFMTFSFMACITILFFASTFVIHRRNRHLKELLAVSNERNGLMDEKKKLLQDIGLREEELAETRRQLKTQNEELNLVEAKLEKVNDELEKNSKELKEKEQQLSDRIRLNKTFLNLLHQSELEGRAEDVILAIRQSSEGKKNMQAADWKQLYNAVDKLYPSFKEQLLKENGIFTEQQMQVCYLMRIGLSKAQIQNMTNLSRVTVWRWVKKYDWVTSGVHYQEGSAETMGKTVGKAGK